MKKLLLCAFVLAGAISLHAQGVRGLEELMRDARGRDRSASYADFDDWRVDVCPHHGPSIAADTTGALHAVWFTGAANKAGEIPSAGETGTKDLTKRP